MRRLAIIIGIAISLTGCAAHTPSELVETSSTTETFCYSASPKDVDTKLEAFLLRCWGNDELVVRAGGSFVPLHPGLRIRTEQRPNGNRYWLENFVGVGYTADVSPGSGSCSTEVKMYGLTIFWKGAFASADASIKGEKIRCP
jgi:hypothetical protein